MKRFYVIINCQILALILFLSTHYLQTIYYYSRIYYPDGYLIFLGDLALFIAIGLQILSILLIISLEVPNEK